MIQLIFLICVVGFSTAPDLKAETKFRFVRGEGVTGIPTWVFDENGKETTIIFSDDSNPKTMFVLDSLLDLEGVWGYEKAKRDARGITTEQAIILVGEFSSEEKWTPKVENGADSQPYRELKVSRIEIGIPFSQWIQRDKEDPITSPYAVLFHLSVQSIFPSGLKYKGNSIDLKSLEMKLRSEQGAAGNPLGAQ